MAHFMIYVTFPNGNIRTFDKTEFEDFGCEMEHKSENIILNTSKPSFSFVYETDMLGEITNKEKISYRFI